MGLALADNGDFVVVDEEGLIYDPEPLPPPAAEDDPEPSAEG